MNRQFVFFSSVFLIVAAPLSVDAAEIDAQVFGRDIGDDKAYACFSRHYSRSHLSSHPEQNVRDMTLLVDSYVDGDQGRQYLLTMSVNFRRFDKPFSAFGGCARSSIGSKSALACGIDCDGGTINVRVKDTRSVLLDIPDGARVEDVSMEEGDEPPAGAKFGSDDKVFRLDRTKLSDCAALATDPETRAALRASK